MIKEKIYVASLSGGKDSTAMVLRLIEEKYPLDLVLFCDTGLEFPQMYEHIEKLEKVIPVPLVKLKAEKSFEYYLLEHRPKIRRSKNLKSHDAGYSWADARHRWCTSVLKVRVIDKYLRELKEKYEVIQYIGIAADEKRRIREHRYPLVEWGMTEKECLEYCYARGYDWGGLYSIFRRVSCWCCPLQPLDELRKLRKYFPELWDKLLEWQSKTWRKFKETYSVQELDIRFRFEEERIREGKPVKGKEFFRDLRVRFGRKEGEQDEK